MSFEIFTKSVRDNRRAWLIWMAALVGVAAMYTMFYPSIGQNPEMSKLMDSYPKALRDALNMNDITSAEGYLGVTVFGLLVPILLAIFAISYGVKAIAADEESGTLELIITHPVGRTSLALQRFGAVAAALLLIALAIFLSMLLMREPAQLGTVSVGRFAAICFQLFLFGLFFASLTFCAGAATGRRGLAMSLGAGVAVLGYLANTFLPQVGGLEWSKHVSPFYWYLGGEPLRNGLQWADCGLMLGLSVALVVVGVLWFERRDLGV